jgi:cystathionine beta-lyase
MMKYDFTSIIDRRGKDAVAVDAIGGFMWGVEPRRAKEGFDEIPMWVADMNFATAPSVTRALTERISHPLYGYFAPSEEYYDRIINWQVSRHGYRDLTKREIGYENGVHGGIISTINSLTEPGDPVFLHSPSYVGFLGDLKETGRQAVLSPLKRDENGVWRMDFEDMDRKLAEKQIHLVIFCSPHNPTGRVWERWEIERAMDIFKKHDCIVISDEIWSDIVFSGHEHIPTAMVSEDAKNRTIGFYAPSKTFNLAGLIGSYHIIFNPILRRKITVHGNKTHYNDMNVLSMHALIGAYSKDGAEWTDELNLVLEGNCRYAVERIDRFEGCSAAMPQGTYMVFMNVEEFCKKKGCTLDDVLKAGWDVGVAYQDGRKFAADWSIRLNTAMPLDRVREAFGRLETYVFV